MRRILVVGDDGMSGRPSASGSSKLASGWPRAAGASPSLSRAINECLSEAEPRRTQVATLGQSGTRCSKAGEAARLTFTIESPDGPRRFHGVVS